MVAEAGVRDNEIRKIFESIEHSEALPEMSGLAGFALRSIAASS